MTPLTRLLLGSLLVGFCWVAASGIAQADTFDEYELAESFSLPAGGGVFDFLNDGRLVALVGADLYVETDIRSRSFDFLGSLADANIPSFGAAFLRVSPDGTTIAAGNNQFGAGAEVGIFELIEKRGVISVDWYEAQHFDATWYDDTTLLLTDGFDGTAVTVLDITNPDAPAHTMIIDNIGGASAGIALDEAGNLYTGNGFQFGGPSETGWIKYFSHAEWTAALASRNPIDFEAGGILVADLLSASALGFDAEGNLHVGGGDFGSDDNNYAGVVRAAAITGAIEGADPADPDDPAAVLKLDPQPDNDFNFYDLRFNRVTCELFVREGDAVYVYRGTNPYAAEVVEYIEGAGVGNDFITGDPFNDPTTALGRPTIDTTGDGISIPVEQAVPLVPVNSAFRAFELVSVGSGGHLTLKFNHPVEDHACNPFGIDFIVYGNAFQVGGSPWTNGDPNAAVVGGTTFAEPAQVSVSQDGINWFAFADGPFADDFAPTLGRMYDPENPDRSLGEWNEWWGQPTDPTKPLDPELVAGDFLGSTVAEVALLYDGAAGGTGFDLAELGLDWIQYIRIEPTGAGVPEIDAVADVAPSTGSETGPDLNGDGVVDPIDLAMLLGSWGPCDCCLADLNGDGMVGPVDLATLLGSWG